MAQAMENMTAVTWEEANQGYLQAELRRLRLLFRRKVRWLRRNWRQDHLASNHGMVISDALADRLLDGEDEGEESRFYQSDEESRAITQALEEMEAGIAILRQRLTEEGGLSSLEALTRSFGLNPFERDALLLCFAIEEDPAFATLCAYVQDDVNARYATPHLALSVLCQSREDRGS